MSSCSIVSTLDRILLALASTGHASSPCVYLFLLPFLLLFHLFLSPSQLSCCGIYMAEKSSFTIDVIFWLPINASCQTTYNLSCCGIYMAEKSSFTIDVIFCRSYTTTKSEEYIIHSSNGHRSPPNIVKAWKSVQ